MNERVPAVKKCPNLFLIGAQKGGSSTLARHLTGHPEIRFFSIKEPHFFRGERVEDCVAALQSQAAPDTDETYFLDASVDYTRFPLVPHVPQNISEICGEQNPKFIYILRNPFDRATSEYFWKRERYGEYRTIEEALTAESQYISTSRYDQQIAQYLEYFDRDAFRFVKFDDYFSDTEKAYADLCSWLGITVVPVESNDVVLGRTNKDMTKTARFKMLNWIAYSNPRVRSVLKSIVPHRVLSKATSLLSKSVAREQIPNRLRTHALEHFFAESIENTETMTGLDLSDWKVGAEQVSPLQLEACPR
jgi:hypothetical protein